MTALFRFSGLLLEGVIALALMLMMVATTVDVVGRYFFNAPLSGGVEIIELTLAVVVFGAYPLVTWRRAHICVDLLDDYVPDSWVRWREVVINLVSAAALGWWRIKFGCLLTARWVTVMKPMCWPFPLPIWSISFQR